MVSVKNISKKFKDIQAIKNISLDVPKGVIFGLLGPNGAGKSTTINIISGLISQDHGEVEIMGSTLKNNEKYIKSNMGVCFQDIVVFDDLSVEENLEYFGRMYGLKGTHLKKNMEETLEFIKLTDHRKKRPKKFSGGMKRRLNIGCAIIHKPQLLILDEPTVGIDVQSRNHILESIIQLNKNGSTIIYTSHYLEEVEQICDQIAIVDSGEVIASGSIEEIIEKYSLENLIEVMLLNTVEDSLVKVISDLNGVKMCDAEDNRIKIKTLREYGDISQIVQIVVKSGNPIRSITMKNSNLEDVFLKLTGKSLRD